MTTLTMRPYAGEADLEAIADFLNACEAVDKFDEWTSVSDLRLEFNSPSLARARDIRLWEGADGKLIGFGKLRIPPSGQIIDGFLSCRVHPSARGGTLEKQIVAWGGETMREVGRDRKVPVKLRSATLDDKADRIALLESSGFSAERYFPTMTRSLREPIPEPQLPAGFTLRQVRSEDAELWVEMHNQSFIDHWNHHPLPVEHYKHWQTDPNYKPEWDMVAIAPDGTFAADCRNEIFPEDNKNTGRNEGWIDLLGTRRGFRRMGLGRAMLLNGLRQLQAAGLDTAKLGVDFDNPNGAKQLYESVGFRKLYTWIIYVKDV